MGDGAFEDQEMRPAPRKKPYPEVDLKVSRLPPQSASVLPVRRSFPSILEVRSAVEAVVAKLNGAILSS